MVSGRIVYAVAVVLAFVAATLMKRDYEQRHGSVVGPHRRAMALSALFGAALGSKLGMVLFLPWSEWSSMFFSLEAFGDGKTIVGAIAGGFIAVELMKRALGITVRTGDVYAIALPLGAGIGRIGCAFAGCCYGRATTLPFAVHVAGADRHPSPLYESAMLLTIAAVQYATQDAPLPLGHRFRWTLVAMACARFLAEFVRGDRGLVFGPLSAVQWLCAFIAIAFTAQMRIERATHTPCAEARDPV